MTTPNEETRRKCNLISGRFMGDPSHEYEHSPRPQDGEGGGEGGEGKDLIRNINNNKKLTKMMRN